MRLCVMLKKDMSYFTPKRVQVLMSECKFEKVVTATTKTECV